MAFAIVFPEIRQSQDWIPLSNMEFNMTHPKCVWALSLALAATSAAAMADTPSFVKDGKLTICTSGDFPPMQFYQNPGDTDMVGYEVDLVHAFAEHWGVGTDFVVGDFAGLLPSLAAERCDMVASGMSLTQERLEIYDGIGHMNTYVVMVVPAADTTTTTPEDLSGKILAIEGGTTYEDRAKNLNDTLATAGKPLVDVQTYPGAARVFEQILIGRAAATITQDTTAAFRETQLPGQLAIPFTYPEVETYAIYIRKDAADLAALKEGFSSLKDSGKLAEIVAKWKLAASIIDVKN
ncbi:transporter substrate-binding domain-containing protein [Pseudotabrizicola sp. 4114]|uniref:transporter substrate-binding domain-containing protein n=1 Tax=Pseudotabrizicola sp. 4114 TaxID=2817731 RepID=UPI0028609813|nr:polar amino acid transport system substrate-binding protein [Pseudorhodobacter sp. 4114]